MGSPRRQQCTQGAPHLPANLSPARGARGGALQHLPCPGAWKGCIRLGCGTLWAGGWGSCPRRGPESTEDNSQSRAQRSPAGAPLRPSSHPRPPQASSAGAGPKGQQAGLEAPLPLPEGTGGGGQKRHIQSGGSWALLHFSCKGRRESSPVTPTPSVTSQGGSRGGYRVEGGILVPLNPCIASLSSSPQHPLETDLPPHSPLCRLNSWQQN